MSAERKIYKRLLLVAHSQEMDLKAATTVWLNLGKLSCPFWSHSIFEDAKAVNPQLFSKARSTLPWISKGSANRLPGELTVEAASSLIPIGLMSSLVESDPTVQHKDSETIVSKDELQM